MPLSSFFALFRRGKIPRHKSVVCRTATHLSRLIVCFMLGTGMTGAAAWTSVGSTGFAVFGAYPSLSIAPDNSLYVAYADIQNDFKATVTRFNGSSWEAVGQSGFSAGEAVYLKLVVASNGVPYIAFQDKENDSKVTVMRFNGKRWKYVGSLPHGTRHSYHAFSLAVAPDNSPYVAYEDSDSRSKATVVRFNGTHWETVGHAGFSADRIDSLSLAVTIDGPYVVFSESEYDGKNKTISYKPTVMHFNGIDWQNVGNPRFSESKRDGTVDLTISSDGTPHVAFNDAAHQHRITVMRLDRNVWRIVGEPGFSTIDDAPPSLASAPDGGLYVAYSSPPLYHTLCGRPRDLGDKVTVMRFNGVSWETVGNEAFSAGGAYSPSLAISNDGSPYVVYKDLPNRGLTVMQYSGSTALSSTDIRQPDPGNLSSQTAPPDQTEEQVPKSS